MEVEKNDFGRHKRLRTHIAIDKNKSYKNLFFFFFNNTLTAKLDENIFAKKSSLFFQLESFDGKSICNLHSFNKINDFAITQHATVAFYQFYLNS